MGLINKLPLLNSQNKLVKIFGYFLYAFVILGIIGAVIPSEDTGTTPAKINEKTEANEETGKIDNSGALTVDYVKHVLPYDNPVDVTVEGGDVSITLPFKDNWNNEYIVMGARLDAIDIFKELFKDNRVNSVTVKMQVPLVDKYGNEDTGAGTTYTMKSTTAAKINWDNFDYNNLDRVADYSFVHPALKD